MDCSYHRIRRSQCGHHGFIALRKVDSSSTVTSPSLRRPLFFPLMQPRNRGRGRVLSPLSATVDLQSVRGNATRINITGFVVRETGQGPGRIFVCRVLAGSHWESERLI